MLKVLAKGSAMVSHLETLAAGGRRYVGRKHDPSLGVNGGWVPVDEPELVADVAEYRKHVAEGDLWPADEATAARCGVKFDPHFGAEPHTPAAAIDTL